MKNVLITSKDFAGAYWPELEELLNINGCRAIFNPAERAMSANDICQMAQESKLEGILVYSGSDEMTRQVFAQCQDLKVVSRHGVGTDNIDLIAAADYGVAVKTTNRCQDHEAVADLTFGLMLSVARRISEVDRALRSDRWFRPIASDVWGKTLGIVGLGRIGKAVARRAKGFDMKIIAFDPYADAQYLAQENIEVCDFETLLRNSDFVTLHCSLNDQTRGLIGPDQLAMMKSSSFLINAARAGLVDGAGLRNALLAKQIAGAGIDVHPVEPAINDPLLKEKLDNLVATSHIASYTSEVLRQMDYFAVQNMIDVLKEKYRA